MNYELCIMNLKKISRLLTFLLSLWIKSIENNFKDI